MPLIIPQRALLKIREYTFSSIFCCPSANRFFSPFFQHMKINTAVKKTTYTIKNPSLLADPVTLLLPIKISKIYDKSTVQPCQVIGKPHPNPYFFAGNQIFFLSFSKIQEWSRYYTDEQNRNAQFRQPKSSLGRQTKMKCFGLILF